MRIRWVGPYTDPTGYGRFSRFFIKSLQECGHEVYGVDYCFESEKVSFMPVDVQLWNGEEVDANIVNLTPNLGVSQIMEGCKNIIFTMFETSKMPDLWVNYCKEFDAIFVPCEQNKEIFSVTGVPVHVVNPGIDLREEDLNVSSLMIPGVTPVTYTFYSIFQNTERKNVYATIRAYLSEFDISDDVALLLKCYAADFSSAGTQDMIKQIEEMCLSVLSKNKPAVFLIADILDDDHIMSIHRLGDCFVLPSRGEGWGLPTFEACQFGNDIIATDYGGHSEFIKNPNSKLPIGRMEPIFNMPWLEHYDCKMQWADPSVLELMRMMRAARSGVDCKNNVSMFTAERSVEMLVEAVNSLVPIPHSEG